MALTQWWVKLTFIHSETYEIPLEKRDFSQGARRGGATVVSDHCFPLETEGCGRVRSSCSSPDW